MKIIVPVFGVDIDLYRRWLSGVAEVVQSSIFDIDADAYVTPGNSFGFMDGGLDQQFAHRYPGVADLVHYEILGVGSELLVGDCVTVGLWSPKSRARLLIYAPTMRVPQVLPRGSINVFLATRAAMREALYQDVNSVAIPAMGTGVGGVSPEDSARQMFHGIMAALEDIRPTSWQEAAAMESEIHGIHPAEFRYGG